jgi:hypothetical protein
MKELAATGRIEQRQKLEMLVLDSVSSPIMKIDAGTNSESTHQPLTASSTGWCIAPVASRDSMRKNC